MRSSQAAAEAGVNVQTLRYYERRGLLPHLERSESGYRSYPDQAVRTVRFVKRAQRLGFSLEEIESLLELAAGGPESCDSAKALATRKIEELDQKIHSLAAMRDSLSDLVATCHRAPGQRLCPLLDTIEDDGDIGATTGAADLVTKAERAGVTFMAASQHQLSSEVQALHRTILRSFLDSGSAPPLHWVRQRAVEVGLDAHAALAALAAADLVHVEEGQVSVAYPFSNLATTDRVWIDAGPPVWAMCAIDALGVLLMSGRDGVICSRDPHSGQEIRVERRGRRWSWAPESTVVVWGIAPSCSRAVEACCANVGFHASAEAARAYLRAHPSLSGSILDHRAALEVADLVFGALLHETGAGHGRDVAAQQEPGDEH